MTALVSSHHQGVLQTQLTVSQIWFGGQHTRSQQHVSPSEQQPPAQSPYLHIHCPAMQSSSSGEQTPHDWIVPPQPSS